MIVQNEDYDLTGVAPYKRQEIRQRITAIERYLEAPTAKAASASAANIGLSISSFLRLARLWRTTREPDRLHGARRPMVKPTVITDKARALTFRAQEERADETVEAVYEHAVRLAEIEGIGLPSKNTVRNVIEDARRDAIWRDVAPTHRTLVVVHCMLEIPTDLGTVRPSLPIATLVLARKRGNPIVVGLALAGTGPNPKTTARALSSVFAPIAVPADGSHQDGLGGAVALHVAAKENWADIIGALEDAGLAVTTMRRTRVARGTSAPQLVGRRIGGISLRPGHLAQPPSDRKAKLRSGQSAMTLSDAEEFARGRMVCPIEPDDLPLLTAGQLSRLIRALDDIATG